MVDSRSARSFDSLSAEIVLPVDRVLVLVSKLEAEHAEGHQRPVGISGLVLVVYEDES